MSDPLPPDVRAVLKQLFAEARTALAAGDVAVARSAVESAETVVANKLPAGDRRERLRHGCRRVRGTIEEPGTDAAEAYLAAMERRLD